MWPLILANLLVGLLLGGMVFFAAVATPTAFKALPKEMSRAYIRAIFPRYYALMGALAFLAAVTLALEHPSLALLMALVTVGFVVSRQVLMPLINKWRDAGLAGDKQAMKSFRDMHRMSVGLNLVQMLTVLLVLVQLAAAGAMALEGVRP